MTWHMETERDAAFQRNQRLEDLLRRINGLLGQAETDVLAQFQQPKYPVVLIVGPPRSGTTLMLQWLAATGQFSYPTNLLARFYGAPHIGALIQQLITDPRYNYKDELLDAVPAGDRFRSDLGKTRGMLQPSEFWYFWRRFVPHVHPEYLDEAAVARIDGRGFAAGVASIEGVFDQPFAMKGINLQYNLAALAGILDKVLFLHTRRHPFYNIQSLLGARRTFFGNIDSWYSVKPREYPDLADKEPHEQVAGQIYYTNRHIERELESLDPAQGLTVDYEDFCASPETIFEALRGKLAALGYPLAAYRGPASFEVKNQVRVDPAERDRILEAYQRVSGGHLTP